MESNFSLSVELWTVGNYHWYLKQNLPFSPTDCISTVQWDSEQAYRLHVVCRNGQYLQYTWSWTTDVSRGSTQDDVATVAVIDGGKYSKQHVDVLDILNQWFCLMVFILFIYNCYYNLLIDLCSCDDMVYACIYLMSCNI